MATMLRASGHLQKINHYIIHNMRDMLVADYRELVGCIRWHSICTSECNKHQLVDQLKDQLVDQLKHQLVDQLKGRLKMNLKTRPIGSLLNPCNPVIQTPVPQAPRKPKTKQPAKLVPKQTSHTHQRQPVTKPRQSKLQRQQASKPAGKPQEITMKKFWKIHTPSRKGGSVPAITKEVEGGLYVKTL